MGKARPNPERESLVTALTVAVREQELTLERAGRVLDRWDKLAELELERQQEPTA